MMELDNVFRSIGDYGRGQILIYTIVCGIAQLPASWHIFAILFIGATPDHLCPGEVNGSFLYGNASDYAACGQNDSSSCPSGWLYSEEVYRTTIVSEWDLVCDRSRLVELSQTVLMVGVIIGSFTFGDLVDRFGRKNVLFIGLFVQGVVGIGQALSPSITVFIIIRLFVGIFDQSYELPVYSIVSELFTPRCRPYAFICLLNFWAAGIFTLPCLAYFIRDWRYLQFAISFPFLLFPMFYWIVPESPRWLLSVGRHEEASKIVNWIAKLNGKPAPNYVFSDRKLSRTEEKLMKIDINSISHVVDSKTDLESNGHATRDETDSVGRGTTKMLEAGSDFKKADDPTEVEPVYITTHSESDDTSAKESSNSYLALFKGYRIALVSTIMAILWFASAFSYYGVSLNSGRLVGDPYLNVFLSGIVELPSHIAATAIVVWFGRRWTICVTLLMTCVSCVGLTFIPEKTNSGVDLTPAIVATATAGKFFIAISYAIACLYATEVFPTTLRNKGVALVAIAARVGALLAPFVLLLEVHSPKAAMIIFGSVALVPGLLVLLLPEMKGRHQPQTIADLESFIEEDRQRKLSKKTSSVIPPEMTSNSNKAFEPEEGNEPVV